MPQRPSSFKLIKSVFLIIFLALVSEIGFCDPVKKPNIIVLIADDLGVESVSYNNGPISTPFIDRLAGQSIRLDRFYADTRCASTRAAFLTGQYAVRNSMEAGYLRPASKHGLSRQALLFPEILQNNGYSTYLIGKWHLGHHKKWMLPLQRGFDFHYGLYCDLVDYVEKTNQGVHDWHLNEKPSYDKGHTTDLISKEVSKILNNHVDSDNPFYIQVAFNAAHGPNKEARRFIEKYSHIENKELRKYAASTDHLDEAIGRILKTLESNNMLQNTIIIFFSDNGAPHRAREFVGGGLRGYKSLYYEGGVRVPAFIYLPEKDVTSYTYTHPVHVTDLFPTLLSLTDLHPPDSLMLDGKDRKNDLLHNLAPKKNEFFLGMGRYGSGFVEWPYKILETEVSTRHHYGYFLLQLKFLEFKKAILNLKIILRRFKQALLGKPFRLGYLVYNLEIDPYEKNDIKNVNPILTEKLKDKLHAFTDLSKEHGSWFSVVESKSLFWKKPKVLGPQ